MFFPKFKMEVFLFYNHLSAHSSKALSDRPSSVPFLVSEYSVRTGRSAITFGDLHFVFRQKTELIFVLEDSLLERLVSSKQKAECF